MSKFRYSLNGGASWTVIDAALPYIIPSAASDDVIVEPIGAAMSLEGAYSLPVTLAVTPSLFAGTAQLTGWAGNCAKVANSGSVLADIGFAANRLNMTAVETHAGGANADARIDTLYDQSGGGYNLTQATSGARPRLYRTQAVGAAQPFVAGPNIQMTIPAGHSVDRANHSVMLVMRPTISKGNFYWLSLGGTNFRFGTASPDDNPNGGLRVYDVTNNVRKFNTKHPRSDVTVVGYSSGASDVKIYNDRTVETVAGGFASGALAGGVLENGNGYSEIFAVVIFPRALTEAEMTQIGRQLEAIATPVRGQTMGLILQGDSLTAGQGGQLYANGLGWAANEMRQLQNSLGYPSSLAVFNFGVPSIPENAWDADKAREFPPLLAAYPNITRWVARVHMGINGLRAHRSDTQCYASIVSNCSYLRGLGIKVIASTINIQGLDGTYNSTDEANRQSVNAQIRANWATFADALVDYDAIPEAADPNNTTWFTPDKLHQTPALYGLKATLLKPAVETLLAA